MRARFLVALLAAAAIAPVAAQAQYHASEDAASGAAAGNSVAGPVGAAVGAAVGGTVGAAGDIAHDVLAPPPPPVITYVQREDEPSVTVEKDVVVGRPLPPRVKVYVVPHHRRYAYAIVNHERVIVNPRTRTVIKVIHAD
jgi:Protein of unknown function (DUF1236)